MSSRSLEDLEPETRAKAKQFLAACELVSIDILIYCTYRSNEEQDELYSHGRTAHGNIVTNARGGDSFHNHHRAFDFVPMVNGKPQWSNTELYKVCGLLAESVGLEWAGRWTGRLREVAHCQFTNGLSLSQLKGKK